jgi:hypothetical protein
MDKILYLTRREWAATWIQGGKIPIHPSSTYRSQERRGKFTPDENLIRQYSHDIRGLEPYISIQGAHKNIRIGKLTINGRELASNFLSSRYEEDGAVLCFSNTFSAEVGRRLGKTAAIRIMDMIALKSIIDSQVGTIGEMGPCEYTTSEQRNHFLKSIEDSWQDEFRIFWPIQQRVDAIIPPGLAEYICDL